jgi:excinuclease ABC subunit B
LSQFKLVSPYQPAGDQPQAIEKLVAGLQKGHKFQTLLGLTGTGKTFLAASVIEKVNKPTIVIAHNKTLAAQLYEEYKAFFPENAVEYFVSYYDYYQPEAYIPQSDTYIDKDSSINEELERLRFSATQSLISRKDVIVVASVSCIYGIGNPEDYARERLTIQPGQQRPRDELIARLVDLYYTRNDMDPKPGTFRIRGDTVDVMMPGDETITRIELWGEKVEAVRIVDRTTGEIERTLGSITIYPAKHFVMSETLLPGIARIGSQLEERLAELKKAGKILEAARLEQRTKFDVEMLRNVGVCTGIENYSQPLTGRPRGDPGWCLLDYFGDDFLMVIDESHQTVPQLRGMYNGDRARKEILIDYGFRLPSALDNRPLKFEEFEKKMPQVVFTSATPGPYELKQSQQVVELVVRPTGLLDPEIEVRATKGQIDDLLAECNKRAKAGERVLVTTLTKRMAEDLTEYFRSLKVRVEYLHSDVDTLERVFILEGLRRGDFDVLVGINLLREGLDLPEVSLVAILDADKYGFLRSETSLIQTIGRAARNIHGKVLMYADGITPAMKIAIDTTNARRGRQQAYNEQHGIVPRSAVRKLKSMESEVARKKKRAAVPLDLLRAKKKDLNEDQRTQLIKTLETEMRDAAKALDFEKAALLRDKLIELRT